MNLMDKNELDALLKAAGLSLFDACRLMQLEVQVIIVPQDTRRQLERSKTGQLSHRETALWRYFFRNRKRKVTRHAA